MTGKFRLPEMEGPVARWYARNRGTEGQLAQYRSSATDLTDGLPDGAAVLEIAPGPGYHAIELARSGRFHVTGVDISHTMIDIARENAQRAGVEVRFRLGDASDLPLDSDSVDLIVCQAAFKNFLQPAVAITEMHRVLRVGGTAVIQDLRKDASGTDIDREIAGYGANGVNAVFTKVALSALRHRAYTVAGFEQLVAETPFRTADIRADGIGIEVRLTKRSESQPG